MQNIKQKFRQLYCFWETRYLIWKFGIFDKLQLSFSSIFLAETSHTFSIYQCLQKGVWDFFIAFRSWVICENLKRPGFYTLVFYTFINNSKSKQNKRNSTHPFVDITK